MASDVRYFGIRHHGPGSARRLIEALDELRPAVVLIEGPADASELLAWLARPDMVPPVALLAYDAAAPSNAVFWPFAEFSPEYRAVRWAVEHGAAVRFIDLPAAIRLYRDAPAPADDADGEASETGEAEAATTTEGDAVAGEPPLCETDRLLQRDPLAVLARIAGYEDTESWWSDVIEENPAPGPVFAAVNEAMSALRAAAPGPLEPWEARREAHMRLEIHAAAEAAAGPVAVVCGAWHVPALTARHKLKDDRALLRGLGKCRIAATWAPWTAPRLAFGSGYGAGVAAPGWYRHVWQQAGDPRLTVAWLGRITAALRQRGHAISTASLIDAEQLAHALSAIRHRPRPGFEECRDASIATLCHGERLLWDDIAAEVLIGAEVGEIPTETPLSPLLEDLQRQQKTARLKPEALQRELALDLRTEAGLFRSTLLHRLNALGVPWGRLADAGRSRGTFRERWLLVWEPEFAVRLVERLVYGATIEQAAGNCLLAGMNDTGDLARLAELVFEAMTARLDDAAHDGTRRLGRLAAQTSDCGQLLAALPPMAQLLRYGEARAGDAVQLAGLIGRILTQAAIALPHAARNLDAEAAAGLRHGIEDADAAVRLVETAGDELANWQQALAAVLDDDQATALVAGTCARLLYEAETLAADAAALLLRRRLSPGTTALEAAGFFEGFFGRSGHRLIYDEALRAAVDGWLVGLDEEDFVANLPLFRRVFSALDAMESRRLLDAVLGTGATRFSGRQLAPDGGARWQAHLLRLKDILDREATSS